VRNSGQENDKHRLALPSRGTPERLAHEALAEKERALITARTKAAIAAAKPRVAITGQKKHPEVKRLGNPNGAAHLRQYGGKAGRAALIANADKRAAGLAATIDALRAEGVTSANGIAKALNERSIARPRGGKWTARSVLNLTARLA
jgi:DNA invertase Pin-like site-specific DNA recombinase